MLAVCPADTVECWAPAVWTQFVVFLHKKQNCMIVRWYIYALHAVLLDRAVPLFFAAFFTLDASAFFCRFQSTM